MHRSHAFTAFHWSLRKMRSLADPQVDSERGLPTGRSENERRLLAQRVRRKGPRGARADLNCGRNPSLPTDRFSPRYVCSTLRRRRGRPSLIDAPKDEDQPCPHNSSTPLSDRVRRCDRVLPACAITRRRVGYRSFAASSAEALYPLGVIACVFCSTERFFNA